MTETILIVDDEKIITDLTSMVLTSRGFTVHAVSSGHEALAMAEQLRPALVLLDYMMPGLDGMQVLRSLRTRFPDTYVVMFTGKGSEELAVELMKAGASDYLRKPFNNQDLVDRIENVLHIRRVELRNRDLMEERERLLAEIAEWNRELEHRVEEKSRELEQAQAEIIQAEKLGALGQLSAGLAHEIRNPLNSISLFSQVLRQMLPADSDMADYPERIIAEIRRIDDLLVRLLNVSEMPQGQLAQISLPQVAREVLDSFSEQIHQQNVQVKERIDSELPLVQADPDELKQIFTNLVANSLQEMPQGGTLSLSVSASDGALKVQIADTGGGIPSAHLYRIFDPFFTTKPRGTGFGLPTVLRVVRSYNGRIMAGNQPGGGARFDIELPHI